ncbi:hypothetical protein [Sphingomonas sp. PB4P5]|uniref:hypothetical protein n=1 Tax=Parasphingomonas puruogangriensis TaxID=3096155 RepID=UPI002FC916F8
MQTERVTFLTTPEQKTALDSFAANSGKSVGHVLREASSRYIVEGELADQEALAFLAREVEAAVPRMRADIRETIDAIERANKVVDAVLANEVPRA